MNDPVRPDLDALEKVMTNYRVYGTAYYGNPVEMLGLIAYARALEARNENADTLLLDARRLILGLQERAKGAEAQLATVRQALESARRDLTGGHNIWFSVPAAGMRFDFSESIARLDAAIRALPDQEDSNA